MINTYLEDNISSKIIEDLELLSDEEGDIFSELVSKLGMNIKRHLRYANLRGVCFSNSDLRGFDFTGSDLQGSYGKDVRWDETTNFEDANVSGSIFAYELEKRSFFTREPAWHVLYMRKKSEYWASNINWFAERLAGNSPDKPHLVEVAKAICDTTTDSFLRSQLLLALAPTFSSSSAHRDFLIHNIEKHYTDLVSVRSTIRVLSALYADDQLVFDLLKREAHSENRTVREAAIKGVIASKHFRSEIPSLCTELGEFSSEIRRMYVRRIARIMGGEFVSAVTEPSGNMTIDFADPITPDKIDRIARARLVSEAQKRAAGRLLRYGQILEPNIKESDVVVRSNYYKNLLLNLRDRGIPFSFR